MPDFYSDLMIEHDGKVMVASTAMLDVTAIREPDPDWTWTDRAGHEHHAKGDDQGHVMYPTLNVVNAAAHWCYNCQDVHPAVWFVCRECGEETLPGVRDGQPQVIKGPTVYMIDDDEVTREQAEEFIKAWQRDLDDANNDPLALMITSRMAEQNRGDHS